MIEVEDIEKSKALLADAEVVLIGAGAGLSTAAGLYYGGKRFTDNFSDYIEKYKLTDMYSSAFYAFPTLEEKWGYFSRHIKLNRYDFEPEHVYPELLRLVKDKDYFVITTNGDSLFSKSGFDANKVFATQGEYSKFQCETPCHDTLYDNKEMVFKLVEQQSNCRIPSHLIPTCPVCGKNLVPHLRMDHTFVENRDWYAANERYVDFVKNAQDKKLVMLELGIGFNTPGIIRWPFEQIANAYEKSTLIRVNSDNVDGRYHLSAKNVLVKGDIAEFIERLQ